MHRIALEQPGRAENSWTTGRRGGLHKKPAEQNQQVEERHKTTIKRVKPALARIDLQPKGEYEGRVIGCSDGVVYSRGLGVSGTTDEEPIDGTFLPRWA